MFFLDIKQQDEAYALQQQTRVIERGLLEFSLIWFDEFPSYKTSISFGDFTCQVLSWGESTSLNSS
jgi:hypothetical protein